MTDVSQQKGCKGRCTEVLGDGKIGSTEWKMCVDDCLREKGYPKLYRIPMTALLTPEQQQAREKLIQTYQKHLAEQEAQREEEMQKRREKLPLGKKGQQPPEEQPPNEQPVAGPSTIAGPTRKKNREQRRITFAGDGEQPQEQEMPIAEPPTGNGKGKGKEKARD
jgi:hypothetical protein